MELLPRLSAERSLLCPDELDTPWNRTITDEGNPSPKAKGQSLSHQQAQLAGSDSSPEKRRFEVPQSLQILNVQFGSPPGGGCFEEPCEGPSHMHGDRVNTQTQSARSPPPSGRDERQKVDTGGLLHEADLIVNNDVTRTIVVAGAWSPGRQGLPPYASARTETCGSFEITVDPSPYSRLFTFEPSKGTVSPGSQQMIRVNFYRQPPTSGERSCMQLPYNQG